MPRYRHYRLRRSYLRDPFTEAVLMVLIPLTLVGGVVTLLVRLVRWLAG